MSTAWVIADIMEREIILLGIAVLAVVGLWMWLLYVMRRWSWMPRKRHNRVFIERF